MLLKIDVEERHFYEQAMRRASLRERKKQRPFVNAKSCGPTAISPDGESKVPFLGGRIRSHTQSDRCRCWAWLLGSPGSFPPGLSLLLARTQNRKRGRYMAAYCAGSEYCWCVPD